MDGGFRKHLQSDFRRPAADWTSETASLTFDPQCSDLMIGNRTRLEQGMLRRSKRPVGLRHACLKQCHPERMAQAIRRTRTRVYASDAVDEAFTLHASYAFPF